jgi:hypothetical protein
VSASLKWAIFDTFFANFGELRFGEVRILGILGSSP